MKYEFNTKRFAELIAERKLKKTNVSRILGRKNSSTVQNWIDGKKIESTHLIEICNSLDVNPAEFFLCNGQPIALSDDVKQISYISEKETSSIINQYQDQIAFLQDKLEFEKYRSMSFKEEVEYKQRELDETRNELKKYKDEVMELRKQLLATTTNV